MRALAASKSRQPLGCTQATEIIATPGIVLAAPLPPGCHLATVYSCAIAAKAGTPIEAAEFMAMLSGDPGRDSRRQLGFTLIELLVVLAILGLLAAITVPQVLKYLGRAKTDTARIEIKNIATALDLYLIDVGRYPTQEEGLGALTANPGNVPGWHGPYVNNKGTLTDPWGHPYYYRMPGEHGQCGAGCGIPYARGFVGRCGDDAGTVGAECRADDAIGVP